MTDLKYLSVSGGEISDIDFVNVEALKNLPSLTSLRLHEFGTVDLSFLKEMQRLDSFYCGYANEVFSADSISCLVNLSELTLIGFEVDNLDFLKPLNKDLWLDLCTMKLQHEIDDSIIKAFCNRSITENVVQGKMASWNEK